MSRRGALIVPNAGSSPLKRSLFRLAGEDLDLEARGQVEGIGTRPAPKVRDAAARVSERHIYKGLPVMKTAGPAWLTSKAR